MEEEKPKGLLAEIRLATKEPTREEMNQALKDAFSRPWRMPEIIIMGSVEFIEKFTAVIEEYNGTGTTQNNLSTR